MVTLLKLLLGVVERSPLMLMENLLKVSVFASSSSGLEDQERHVLQV